MLGINLNEVFQKNEITEDFFNKITENEKQIYYLKTYLSLFCKPNQY